MEVLRLGGFEVGYRQGLRSASNRAQILTSTSENLESYDAMQNSILAW